MGIVQEPGMQRVLDSRQAAAGNRQALQAEGLEARAAQVGLEDQAVVARSQDDPIIAGFHAPPLEKVDISVQVCGS